MLQILSNLVSNLVRLIRQGSDNATCAMNKLKNGTYPVSIVHIIYPRFRPDYPCQCIYMHVNPVFHVLITCSMDQFTQNFFRVHVPVF